ncbi:MAG: hypothetical protein HY985_02490 [Magnetospirillum sp.]|nr:hypothetical protein [Magnetospirillum sp.]
MIRRKTDASASLTTPTYEPSNKHCPPYTAPGTRCPRMSLEEARDLFEHSLPMGDNARVATRDGVAFMARLTYPDDKNVWHGYPVEWDKIEQHIVDRWKMERKIKSRDVDRLWSRTDIDRASWGGWK